LERSQKCLKYTNPTHNLGVVLWVALMTPVQVQYVVELFEDDQVGLAVASIVMMVFGWLSLFTFQYINVRKISPHFALEEDQDEESFWSETFVKLWLHGNNVPPPFWCCKKERNDAWFSEEESMRRLFRFAMAFEGSAILFIFAATLLTSYGRIHTSCDIKGTKP